jgi:hypothetical protein
MAAIVGIVITALLQAAVLVGVGVTLFRVPWGSGLLGVVALLVLNVLAVTGLADVAARHQRFGAALMPVLGWLGFAAVSLGIGARILRFE